MYKVGDRVVYCAPEEHIIDETGAVVHAYSDFITRVLVEFDNPRRPLHNGSGVADGVRKKNNACWNCLVSNLTHIAPMSLENV